jgi:aminoglycoside 6'-N-acetyltransferase I
MPLDVRLLGPGDEQILADVASEVFDEDVRPHLAAEFLSDPRHHLAVAIEAGRVVGFASGVHYLHPDKAAELWVNEVGVTPSHRGQGVAKTLLKALFAAGRAVGCRDAWVLTDRANTVAMQLYRASGGVESPDDTVMFEFRIG